MKRIFIIAGFLFSLAPGFAMFPPVNIVDECTVDEVADAMETYPNRMGKELYDITGDNDVTCMDYALTWYIWFNGGLEPRKARIFGNDEVKHAFIGVVIQGHWIFIDAASGHILQNWVAKTDFLTEEERAGYRRENNYDVTEYFVQGYLNKEFDARLARRLKSRTKW